MIRRTLRTLAAAGSTNLPAVRRYLLIRLAPCAVLGAYANLLAGMLIPTGMGRFLLGFGFSLVFVAILVRIWPWRGGRR